MSQLRVGIVGVGGLGRHFAAACDQEEAVGEIALCDPASDAIDKLRTSLSKVNGSYSGIEEMLGAESLDAVCIVTPDHLHRPQAEAAFEAGCHVLLTKPIATNLKDAKAIVRKAESTERKLMIAQERRFRSRWRRVKEIVEAGELGDVIQIRVDTYQNKTAQFKRAPWYASTEAGRTAIVGTGIHEVDLVRHLTGKRIFSAYALGNRHGDLTFHGNKTLSSTFRMEDAAIGQVTVTYVTQPEAKVDNFLLLGTKGMIAGGEVVREGSDIKETLPDDEVPIVTGVSGCVSSFLGSVIDDTPVAISGRDAFASLAACVAADESCESGDPALPEWEDFD